MAPQLKRTSKLRRPKLPSLAFGAGIDRFWRDLPKWARWLATAVFIAFLYILPKLSIPVLDAPGSAFASVLCAPIGVYVLLAIGLNIVVGLAGLLDLGYVAFFAIGAYTYAYGSSPFSGVHAPFLGMLLLGALVAATFGVLLGAPTLRLRGDYLAIV